VSPAEIIALIGGIASILGVAIAVTARLVTASYRVAEERLKEDRRRLQQALADLETSNQQLRQMLVRAREAGKVAIAKLESIKGRLQAIRLVMGVEACSVGIPNRLARTPELIFLALDSPKADAIKFIRVPFESIAGHVYVEGKPRLVNDVRRDPEWFRGVDNGTGFVTRNMITVPLIHDRKTIGVLNLVNKLGEEPFLESDLVAAEKVAAELAAAVADFAAEPGNFELIGLAPDTTAYEGTVILCDLSNSSVLLRAVRPAEAIDRVNEYLSGLIQVGFEYGAVVEMSVGGSFMLRFDVTHPSDRHSLVAIAAALRMKSSFVELKRRWIAAGRLATDKVFCRIAIESGPLFDAVIGHRQFSRSTVLGDPVEVARSLCDFADRNRDVIVIGERAYAAVSGLVDVRRLPQRNIGPARGLITEAYEVLSLHSDALQMGS